MVEHTGKHSNGPGEANEKDSRPIIRSPLWFTVSAIAVATAAVLVETTATGADTVLIVASFLLYVGGSMLAIWYAWLAVTTDRLQVRDLHGSGGVGAVGYLLYYITVNVVGDLALAFLAVALAAIGTYVALGVAVVWRT